VTARLAAAEAAAATLPDAGACEHALIRSADAADWDATLDMFVRLGEALRAAHAVAAAAAAADAAAAAAGATGADEAPPRRASTAVDLRRLRRVRRARTARDRSPLRHARAAPPSRGLEAG